MIISTLAILRQLHDRLPPLVPEEHIHELRAHLDEYEQRHEDDTMLDDLVQMHGRRLWPYMQAFEDMYTHYESELGYKLLSQRVSPVMQQKIDTFQQLGGKVDDMFRGRAQDIFDSDERQLLMELLVDLKLDIRKHAQQKILSQDTATYEEKVNRYGKIMEEVNQVLEDVRQFAHEEAHDTIAEDIHDKIRTIEQSFAFIGPSVDIEEVRNLKEHYVSRQQDLKMRGLIVI